MVQRTDVDTVVVPVAAGHVGVDICVDARHLGRGRRRRRRDAMKRKRLMESAMARESDDGWVRRSGRDGEAVIRPRTPGVFDAGWNGRGLKWLKSGSASCGSGWWWWWDETPA